MAKQNRARLAISSVLALSVIGIGCLWMDGSPFYWYFLGQVWPQNTWGTLNMGPLLLSVMASGNVHQGSTTVLMPAVFLQWFVLFWFLSLLLVRIPGRVLGAIGGSVCLTVAALAWYVTTPERGAARDRVTRFADLKFGLSEQQAETAFGKPNLVCTNDRVTVFGTESHWYDEHAFQPLTAAYSERVGHQTSSRWIYFHRGPNVFQEDEQRSQCLPSKWDTELGFSLDGRLLWFNRTLGDQYPEVDEAHLK
jgi:hypothetical protein